MKQIILLCLMGWLSTAVAPAQPASRGLWCLPGAVWKYAVQTTLTPPSTYTYDVRYTGDSIVSGQSCQKLSSLGAITLTRADADRVWQYRQGQFYKVYDFSAQPGDSWPYLFAYGSCSETAQITVDSIGQRLLGGQQRRWFVAHYTVGGQTVRWGRIYEGVGPVEWYMSMFPAATRVGTCAVPPETPTQLGLRCFSVGSQIGLISVANGCATLPTATQTARAVAAGFVVFPTIGAGELTLKLPVAYVHATVRVYTLAGQLVCQQPLAATPEATLQVGQLPRGLYLLNVQAPGQPPLTQRVVLQ